MKIKPYLLILPAILLLFVYCSCNKKKQPENILGNTWNMQGNHIWTGTSQFWANPGTTLNDETRTLSFNDTITVINEKKIVFGNDTLIHYYTDTLNQKNIYLYTYYFSHTSELDSIIHYYAKNYIEYYSYYTAVFGRQETRLHTP